MMVERILNCICNVFDVEREEVSEDTSQVDIEFWDSIGSVRLLLCLEEEFGVAISPEVGRRMTGCYEIQEQLRKLGVD
jgi:acyl carrier protein